MSWNSSPGSIGNVAAQAGGGNTGPSSLSGLIFWNRSDSYTFSDGSSDPATTPVVPSVTGGVVKSWLDKTKLGVTGNNDFLSLAANGSDRFILTAGGPNGALYLHSTGTSLADMRVPATTPGPDISVAQPYTLFLVYRYYDTGASNRALFDGYAAQRAAFYDTAGGSAIIMYAGSNVNVQVPPNQNWHTVMFEYNTNVSKYRFDAGPEVTGVDPGTWPLSSLRIGAFQGSGVPGPLDICEFFGYNRILNSGEKTQMFAYLQAEYATF